MRGKFITFEGGEGTGKSTQISLLANHLKDLGHDVIVTREPGGTAGAEAVRHILLSGTAEQFGSDMEAILFAAARADHVDQIIAPALDDGKYVLCDRFFDSTRAYQGASGNVPFETLHALEQAACGEHWPDLTLILDLSSKESIARANKRRGDAEADRFERESIKQQELRRRAFLDIAKQAPERCAVIDAAGSIEEISAAIWREIDLRLIKPQNLPNKPSQLKEKLKRINKNVRN